MEKICDYPLVSIPTRYKTSNFRNSISEKLCNKGIEDIQNIIKSCNPFRRLSFATSGDASVHDVWSETLECSNIHRDFLAVY